MHFTTTKVRPFPYAAMAQLNETETTQPNNTGRSYDIREQAKTTTGISTALGFYFVLGLLSLFVFSLIRRKYGSIYAPKMRLKISTPPPIGAGIWSWVTAVMTVSESQILENVGLDAVILLRWVKMCFWLFIFLTVWGLAVIIPINVTAADPDTDPESAVKSNNNTELYILRRFSIENVPDSSTRLRIHIVFVYFFSIVTMFYLARFFKEAVHLRMVFARKLLRIHRKRLDTRSIVVSGIPKNLLEESKLYDYFSKLGIGNIENVVVCRQWVRLRDALEKRSFFLEKLEETVVKMIGNPPKYHAVSPVDGDTVSPSSTSTTTKQMAVKEQSEPEIFPLTDSTSSTHLFQPTDHTEETYIISVAGEQPQDPKPNEVDPLEIVEKEVARLTQGLPRPTIRLGRFGLYGEKVDALNYYLDKFKKYDIKAREYRTAPYASDPTNTAFVTFENPKSATLAAQSIISSRAYTLTTRMAPEPRDLYWRNISSRMARPYVKALRAVGVQVALIFLIVSWSVPVAALTSALSIDNLSKLIPELEPWLTDLSPLWQSFIQSVIPTIVVAIWLGLLPVILYFLSIVQGHTTVSEIERSVLRKYFFYQFFNVLVVFTFVGAVMTALSTILDNPKEIFNSLGNSLPGVAPFFINYINLQSFFLTPLELLRIGPLLWRLLVRHIWPGTNTPRQYAHTTDYDDITLRYGEIYVFPILVGIIGLTYSTIQPLILPFAVIFFAIQYLVLKYIICYIHIPKYETGGSHISMIVKRFVVGILFFQIVMAGVLSLKETYFSALFGIAPIFIITIFFYNWLVHGWAPLANVWPVSIVSEVMDALQHEREQRSMNSPVSPIYGPAGPVGSRIVDTVNIHGSTVEIQASQDSDDQSKLVENEGGERSDSLGKVLQCDKESCSEDPRNQGQPSSSEESGKAADPNEKQGSFCSRFFSCCTSSKLKRRRPQNPYKVWPPEQKWECDKQTDYREPPITRLSGVLDVGIDTIHSYLHNEVSNYIDDLQMRSYLHPALIARLPELWLPNSQSMEFKRARDLDAQKQAWLDAYMAEGGVRHFKRMALALDAGEANSIASSTNLSSIVNVSPPNSRPGSVAGEDVKPTNEPRYLTTLGHAVYRRFRRVVDHVSNWLVEVGT